MSDECFKVKNISANCDENMYLQILHPEWMELQSKLQVARKITSSYLKLGQS